MAVEFTGVSGQGISFASITGANDLVTKTIASWFNIDAIANYHVLIDKYNSDTLSGWYLDEGFGAGTAGKLHFSQEFSGTSDGHWRLDAAPSTGAWHHIAVSYDNSNVANNPVFYLDGASVAITEMTTPIGTAVLENTNIEVGYDSSLPNTTMDGKHQDVRIYNRILSAQEALILAKSRCQNVVLNGLVFWAPLNGAAGLPSFEGATMGASNYVRDVISGAIGTPVGNPLGAGNTIQRIR